MPTGKQGPAAFLLLVDEFNLTASKVKETTKKISAMQEKSDGLGDEWEAHTPTGKKKGEFSAGGGYFDTTLVSGSHIALSADPAAATPQQVSRIVTVCFAGNLLGMVCDSFEGAYQHSYEVIATREELQKANAEYLISGQHDEGVVLQILEAKTADWDTESTPVDNAASSANGGVAYQHITAYSGFSGFIGSVRDSPNDITYGELVAFDDATAIEAQRKTVAGTVERYVAFKGDVTGTGSITVFCGFSRNE